MGRVGRAFIASLFAAMTLEKAALAEGDVSLQEARKLFLEAVDDEEHDRFDVACEKLGRVRDVRDTVNVRYRIGICREGERKTASAVAMYEATLLIVDEGSDPLVVDDAKARIRTLSPHVPRLQVALPADTPLLGTTIQVDGSVLPADGLQAPLPVDPGPHTITVTVDGTERLRTTVELSAGEQRTLTVQPQPPAPAGPPRSPTARPDLHEGPKAPPDPYKPSTRPEGAPSQLPWIAAMAGGGVLLVGAVALYAARNGDIDSLDRRCPGGRCANDTELEDYKSVRDRAKLEQIFSYGMAGVGLAAVGFGVYMVVKPEPGHGAPPKGPSVRVVPAVSRNGGTFLLQGEF